VGRRKGWGIGVLGKGMGELCHGEKRQVDTPVSNLETRRYRGGGEGRYIQRGSPNRYGFTGLSRYKPKLQKGSQERHKERVLYAVSDVVRSRGRGKILTVLSIIKGGGCQLFVRGGGERDSEL